MKSSNLVHIDYHRLCIMLSPLPQYPTKQMYGPSAVQAQFRVAYMLSLQCIHQGTLQRMLSSVNVV